MSHSISITGLGIICAIGNDASEVTKALREGTSGIAPVHYLETSHKDLPVGEVKLSTPQMTSMLGLSWSQDISRTSVMGAIAVKEALKQAGVKNLKGKRTVLVSGTTVGVMDVTERHYGSISSAPQSNECGRSTLETALYAGIPEAKCTTICTACSSALNAIMVGADMLLNDEADIVIAGGSEALSRYHLNGFNSLMILDHQRCRPFDESRAGLNLGEGASYVVLEKDVPDALAFVSGYANRCDAFHQTASSKDGEGATLAMNGALDMARLKPSQIDYVNAHGTGTQDNDASESAAFRRVFGDRIPKVSSTKSYTGHTTSASGSIETAICILAMQGGFIPASLGWSHPFEGGIIPSGGASDIGLKHVMCNSFGFGGNDSSLIISSEPSLRESLPERTVRISSKVTLSEEAPLAGLREFISPMVSRRMGFLMKAALLSAFRALKDAGIKRPDAIVTATSRGMYELSTQFLEDITANGEEQLHPTLFMQSTHNTISSAIAIHTGCHGYNITYSQGEDSEHWAQRDAARLISRGEADNVLVCSFDEELTDGKSTNLKAESIIYTRDE